MPSSDSIFSLAPSLFPSVSKLKLPDMLPTPSPLRSIALAFVLSWVLRTIAYLRRTRSLPPGPPKHIIMDNRGDMDFPLPQMYKSFRAWHQRYHSGVVSMYLGRKVAISLGTIKAATDLLEKKGSIYSSRPRLIVVGEIMSRNMRGTFIPYGQRWRNWRALMHASMNSEASKEYQSIQDGESKIFLRDILTTPGDHTAHLRLLRRYTVSVVTVVAYGRRIKSLDDPLVIKHDQMDEAIIKALAPGKYIVEIFPILALLPKALQWWRPRAELQFQQDSEMLLGLADEVRQRMAQGIAHPSTATRALGKQSAWGLNDLETAYALSAPFGVGSGTTVATFEFFLVGMLLYPRVMRKAQEEIDRVVGRDRLPEFDDLEAMPYLRALVKEVMRWKTIAPNGVPHSLTEDDVYEGKTIPKGTTVFASLYTISKNEDMFPNASELRPERYLEDPSLPNDFVFGFGRRVCPGKHIAMNSLYMLFARTLWAFDVLPPVDPKTGKASLPDPDAFQPGLVVRPAPFEFKLVPRDDGPREEVKRVVLGEAAKAEVLLAPFD